VAEALVRVTVPLADDKDSEPCNRVLPPTTNPFAGGNDTVVGFEAMMRAPFEVKLI
jgi:hypothetical protein